MNKKDFIKIINEEISDFDFLGNDEYLKETENINLLKNEDFQKQFICDSLLNSNKIKTSIFESRIGGNWEESEENASVLTIEHFINIEYKFDESKEPVKFELNFDGNVSIQKSGWSDSGSYDVEPSGSAWFNGFDWRDIKVTLNTTDGDEIDFQAFKRAPSKIQVLFIRVYTESYINGETNLEIRTIEMKDKVQNVPYC